MATPPVPGWTTSALDGPADAPPPDGESRAAQALRARLEALDATPATETDSGIGHAQSQVALIDPSGSLAPPLLQALAMQAGSAVHTTVRLRLRATQRLLASLLDTTLESAEGAPVQVRTMHFDEPALASLDFSLVLAETADLAVVLMHPVSAAGLDRLINHLHLAARRPTWRCRNLLFAGPAPQALNWARVGSVRWPGGLRVRAITLEMQPALGLPDVWLRLMAEWRQMQGLDEAPLSLVADRSPYHRTSDPSHLPAALSQPLHRLLAKLCGADGLLNCGIVDLHRGTLLMQARAKDTALTHSPPSHTAQSPGGPGSSQTVPSLPMLAKALCSAHQAHVAVAVAGGEPVPDELLITAGGRHALLRRLPTVHGLGFLALLERNQANLALLRFQLQDADRLMA